jgi:hypothetical protein
LQNKVEGGDLETKDGRCCKGTLNGAKIRKPANGAFQDEKLKRQSIAESAMGFWWMESSGLYTGMGEEIAVCERLMSR